MIYDLLILHINLKCMKIELWGTTFPVEYKASEIFFGKNLLCAQRF